MMSIAINPDSQEFEILREYWDGYIGIWSYEILAAKEQEDSAGEFSFSRAAFEVFTLDIENRKRCLSCGRTVTALMHDEELGIVDESCGREVYA